MTCKSTFDPEGQLEIGMDAPDFHLPGVDGKEYSLADLRGKVKALVVAFWCNHCPYVIKSEERMIDLSLKYKDKSVGFVLISANDAINYPQDSFKNMKKRAAAKNYPFPYLFNEDQEVAKAYGAKVTPHIFLFDAELKLRYRGAIDDNMDMDNRETMHYLKDAIEVILSDKPVEIAELKTRAVGCSVKWKN